MELKLYDHQKKILNLRPSKHLFAWGTGTGKTVMALALVKEIKTTALVVVPKALKENWTRTADQYDVLHRIHVVSKEEFRRDWDKLPNYPTIIVDEAHYFSNLKSQMSKALLKYQRKYKTKYTWLLTATPYLSTPMNIYALAAHLGYKWNYWSFFFNFFDQVRMGPRLIPKVKKGIEPEIARLVQQIGSTAKLDDLIDVPPQVTEVEYFNLNKDQEKAIKELDDTNFIVRWTKTHQIENGVLYGGEYDDYKTKTFTCDKTERLKDIILANKKVAVFCRYNGQIEYLKEALSDLGRPIFVINGQVKDKDTIVGQVEASDEAVVLINSACSEGYELPSVGVVVFASLSFSYKDFVQAQGRFLRINKPKRNLFIIMVANGVDKAVFEAIKRKEDFNIEMFKKSGYNE